MNSEIPSVVSLGQFIVNRDYIEKTIQKRITDEEWTNYINTTTDFMQQAFMVVNSYCINKLSDVEIIMEGLLETNEYDETYQKIILPKVEVKINEDYD